MVAGFKAEHHDRDAAVGRTGVESFLRVKDAAVRWIEAGLCDGAQRARRTEERMDALVRNFGRGCNRIQAREITPSVPSEPMNMRSGLGPAPDPGNRRVSNMPCGVTTRRLSTKSSI